MSLQKLLSVVIITNCVVLQILLLKCVVFTLSAIFVLSMFCLQLNAAAAAAYLSNKMISGTEYFKLFICTSIQKPLKLEKSLPSTYDVIFLESFNSLIYSLLVRFRGPLELGGPSARHYLALQQLCHCLEPCQLLLNSQENY